MKNELTTVQQEKALMNILKTTLTAVNLPQQTFSIMLNGKIANIRNTLKAAPGQKKQLYNNLNKAVLYLANNYTGANFQRPLSSENKEIIESCTDFIVSMFPMLSPEELKEAFKLATAGKLKDINITTYYGKFTVQILGDILKAYLKLRNKALSKYEKQLQIEQSRKEDTDKEQKNALIRTEIAQIYSQIKKQYIDKGILIEAKIRAFWAKILIEEKIILFTKAEKRAIWQEARTKTQKNLKEELSYNMNLSTPEKIKIRNILKDLNTQQKNENFEAAVIAEYSRLLIIKSIIL